MDESEVLVDTPVWTGFARAQVGRRARAWTSSLDLASLTNVLTAKGASFQGTTSGMLLILAALAVCACGAVTIPAQRSPSQVVKAYILALNDGKYSEAEAMLSVDAQNMMKSAIGQMAGGFKGIADKGTRNGTVSTVETISEEMRGEGAIVEMTVTFKDGSRESGKVNLIRERGVWKMAAQ